MPKPSEQLLSVVVPVFNEQAGIRQFHEALYGVLRVAPLRYEVIYCDDGSTDASLVALQQLATDHEVVRVVSLSRNFGREIATTAGIHAAKGDAIIIVDADGQHPVELIPQFVAKWQKGAKVVLGVRKSRHGSLLKRISTKLFYGLFSRIMGIKLNPNTTDFRLIDRQVQSEFVRMTERNRVTRGLIDWLGYKPEFVEYEENARMVGEATYSFRKLFKLAIDSAISLSTSPLYLVAYIGVFVLPIATILGVGMLVNYFLRDPLHLHATGGAYMMVLVLFLVGVLLVSQGIIGLYLSHIHTETQNRPLYVVDKENSRRIS
jgi:dolichol-phosphate mannosyltransferase